LHATAVWPRRKSRSFWSPRMMIARAWPRSHAAQVRLCVYLEHNMSTLKRCKQHDADVSASETPMQSGRSSPQRGAAGGPVDHTSLARALESTLGNLTL
jgi:hypothetical protein